MNIINNCYKQECHNTLPRCIYPLLLQLNNINIDNIFHYSFWNISSSEFVCYKQGKYQLYDSISKFIDIDTLNIIKDHIDDLLFILHKDGSIIVMLFKHMTQKYLKYEDLEEIILIHKELLLVPNIKYMLVVTSQYDNIYQEFKNTDNNRYHINTSNIFTSKTRIDYDDSSNLTRSNNENLTLTLSIVGICIIGGVILKYLY